MHTYSSENPFYKNFFEDFLLNKMSSKFSKAVLKDFQMTAHYFKF